MMNNKLDMASGNSEVYRIDSQEDIVIEKEISDEVCDSQRQSAEMNSEADVTVGREMNKEVEDVEKEVAMPTNIIQKREEITRKNESWQNCK